MQCVLSKVILEYSQPSSLSTVLYTFLTLKFAAICFCQCTFLQRISENKPPRNKLLIEPAILSEQHRIYTEMGTATRSSYFFTERFFSENFVVWSGYFFLIITSWLKILFLISYFLKINTFPAQLLFWRSYFFGISNYSEHVLFRSRYFFRRATLSDKLF